MARSRTSNILYGMSNQEIRAAAKEYPLTGNPIADLFNPAIIGKEFDKQKAAHNWVLEHDKQPALNTKLPTLDVNDIFKAGNGDKSYITDMIEGLFNEFYAKLEVLDNIDATDTDNLYNTISEISIITKKISFVLGSIDQKILTPNGINLVNMGQTLIAKVSNFITSTFPSDRSKFNVSILEQNASQFALDMMNLINSIDASAQEPESVEPQQVVSQPHQQAAAAHTMSAFNINNFVKKSQPQQTQPQAATGVPAPTVQQTQPKQQLYQLPHETCGLTDQQIVEEVGKHFSLFQQGIPSYALYDLLHNSLLPKKMKEFGSKQRPNNPYLTQVILDEYTDNPETLQKYNLAFTIPCKDKRYVIVIFYNAIPVADQRGCLMYPLNIFKAKLSKPSN